MARPSSNPTPALPVVIVLLMVTTLAPTSFTAWITAFRGPFTAFLAPISHSATWVSLRLRPPVELETSIDSATREQLENQLNELQLLHTRAINEVKVLREQIRQLQSGVPFEDATRFRKVLASRTAYDPTGGTIELRPGSLKGVVINSVVHDGATMQLVGVVSSVGPVTSSVRPITDRRIPRGQIEVVILPDAPVSPEILATAQRCALKPTGSGAFTAKVGVDPYAAIPVQRGMVVRLDDPSWPASARMLVVGRVTRVGHTDQPTFIEITVRPVREPARLRDVVIRIPAASASPQNITVDPEGGTP